MPTYGPSLPHLNPMATGDWKVDEVLPPVSPLGARSPFVFYIFCFSRQKRKKGEREKRGSVQDVLQNNERKLIKQQLSPALT